MSGKVSAPSSSGRAGGGRRRPASVGGAIASIRSRSDWPLRMAVTVAVATPLPTVRDATAAPRPLRRRTWPSDAPEMRMTAAIRPPATRMPVPTSPTVELVTQYPVSPR